MVLPECFLSNQNSISKNGGSANKTNRNFASNQYYSGTNDFGQLIQAQY